MLLSSSAVSELAGRMPAVSDLAGRMPAVSVVPELSDYRLRPVEVPAALARGAVVVDIRPGERRRVEGSLLGGLAIDRAVLELRLDPLSSGRIAMAVDHDIEWIIVCSHGETANSAVTSLRRLGLRRARNLVGGFHALRHEGLVNAAVTAEHFRRVAPALASLG